MFSDDLAIDDTARIPTHDEVNGNVSRTTDQLLLAMSVPGRELPGMLDGCY